MGWSLALALAVVVLSPAVTESLAAPRAPRPGSDPERLVKYPGMVTAFLREDAAGPVVTTARATVASNGGAASIVVTAVQNTRAGSEAEAQEALAEASLAAERETARALERLAQRPGAPAIDLDPLLDPVFSEALAEVIDAPYPRVRNAVCRPGGGIACESILGALARAAVPSS